MTFWLVMLTFIISIFVYALSPREDTATVERPMGESAVAPLVYQHQAAKTYMIQNMTPPETTATTGTDLGFRPFQSSRLQKLLPNKKLIPGKIGTDVALPGDTPEAGSQFVSALACVGTEGTDKDKLASCAGTTPPSTKKYIITYGYQQGWWSKKTKQKEYWRTSVSKITYNSPECGTLLKINDLSLPTTTYRIENPFVRGKLMTEGVEEYIKSEEIHVVPPAITEYLKGKLGEVENLTDMLFCLTPYRQPYDNDKLLVHFDAIKNTRTINGHNETAHSNTGTIWANLGSAAVSGQFINSPVWQQERPKDSSNPWLGGGLYFNGDNQYVDLNPLTPSGLGSTFTIAAVVRFADSTEDTAIKRGSVWGSADGSLVGGRFENNALKFGINGHLLSVPVSLFKTQGATKPVSIVYALSLSGTSSWHALLIDNKVVATQGFTAESNTLSGTTSIRIGRLNSNETFTGNVFNFKVYSKALMKYSGGKISDKRLAYQNFLIDRRRFGVGRDIRPDAGDTPTE